MAQAVQPPSLGDTSTSLFNGRSWASAQIGQDEDDELPLGRNTLKARSKALVLQQQINSTPGPSMSAAPPPPPPSYYGAENGLPGQQYGRNYPPPGMQQPGQYGGVGGGGGGGYGGGMGGGMGGPGMGAGMGMGMGGPPPSSHYGKGAPPPPHSSSLPPPPSASRPPGQPKQQQDWNLTPELMNQPWGTVLRQLNRK